MAKMDKPCALDFLDIEALGYVYSKQLGLILSLELTFVFTAGVSFQCRRRTTCLRFGRSDRISPTVL
jgi:hypothetical protein